MAIALFLTISVAVRVSIAVIMRVSIAVIVRVSVAAIRMVSVGIAMRAPIAVIVAASISVFLLVLDIMFACQHLLFRAFICGLGYLCKTFLSIQLLCTMKCHFLRLIQQNLFVNQHRKSLCLEPIKGWTCMTWLQFYKILFSNIAYS